MTATLDVREGFVVAGAPAITAHARVVLRTDPASNVTGCDPALAVFHTVNAACARFDPDSELRRLNDRPGQWHAASSTCLAALREAWWAYRRTGGQFDPRLPASTPGAGVRLPWRPRFDEAGHAVHLGGAAVDVDCIARGLALRWASRALPGTHHLIDVGGDCYGAGRGPDGAPWRIGIEDPLGGGSPLAVLVLCDAACTTTTATDVRAAGQSAGEGLLAVTVAGPDPVTAEVWSRVLLLAGAGAIGEVAERHRLPAAWVTGDGTLHVSPAFEPKLVWQR